MTSRKRISAVVQNTLGNLTWFPQDMIDLVKTYIDTEVKIYKPDLLPIGVRIITAKKDEDTRALSLFHQLIRWMERMHVLVYVFTYNVDRFFETSTFMQGRVLEFNRNSVHNVSQLFMRVRERSIRDGATSPSFAFFLDLPTRQFLQHEKIRYLFLHAACTRLPVFILLKEFTTIPAFHWSYVSGVITRKLKDLQHYTKHFRKEKETAKEIIDDFDMFFMFSHGIASCSTNINIHGPYRARIKDSLEYLVTN